MYQAPLAIHLFWNCADARLVEPMVVRLCSLLSRDVTNPFSHGVNIPIFVYKSQNAGETPPQIRHVGARKNICFFFSSEETAGRDNWIAYAKSLLVIGNLVIVPVALNSNGLSLFKDINAIRYEDGEEPFREDRCIICILHEIFRYGFIEIDDSKVGKDSSLRIFISHSKGDADQGVDMSRRLISVISNTNMDSFFDATEISPGLRFEDEIAKHLNSPRYAFIAIQTDGYSSRYWCQREVMAAKKNDLPIIVADSVESGEDRSLPALANVPVIRITDGKKDDATFKILVGLLTETIRCLYAKTLLFECKRIGWVDKDAEVLIRPPEVAILDERKISETRIADNATCFVYPEPPLFSIELEWLETIGIKAFTPLQCSGNNIAYDILKGRTIGLSISDVVDDRFSRQCGFWMLKMFAQDLARHILSRSGKLIYGGDLRADGFTEFIISEAKALQYRIGDNGSQIIDYLAWPINLLSHKDILILRSRYGDILEINELEPADDVSGIINKEVAVLPTTRENCYIWSRCLTEMRKTLIGASFARVCAGGKLSSYKGKMPGLLEEIQIAIQQPNMPLYLCGGFGGVVGEVCDALICHKMPESLTEEWQVANNVGYKALQELAFEKGNAADYAALAQTLCNPSMLEGLATRSGLAVAEYKRLMQTPFIEEVIYLILKGLSQV